MATAAAATGGAGAVRAWLAARGFSWLTPQRLRVITFALIAGVLLVSGTLSGSGS